MNRHKKNFSIVGSNISCVFLAKFDLIQLIFHIVDSSRSDIVYNTQIDQNDVVYDPKPGRKCCKNGAFTAVIRVS
jgi:hypothetical protein